MSRGLGRVGRSIAEAIAGDPDNAFTIDDLCKIAFPGLNRIEKKNTASVVRSLSHVLVDFSSYRTRVLPRPGSPIIVVNGHNPHSIGMSFLKSGAIGRYMGDSLNRRTEQELREMLAPGGKRHLWILPGGDYWLASQFWEAEDTGNEARMAELIDQFTSISPQRRSNLRTRDKPARMENLASAIAQTPHDEEGFAEWVAQGRKLAAMLKLP